MLYYSAAILCLLVIECPGVKVIQCYKGGAASKWNNPRLLKLPRLSTINCEGMPGREGSPDRDPICTINVGIYRHENGSIKITKYYHGCYREYPEPNRPPCDHPYGTTGSHSCWCNTNLCNDMNSPLHLELQQYLKTKAVNGTPVIFKDMIATTTTTVAPTTIPTTTTSTTTTTTEAPTTTTEITSTSTVAPTTTSTTEATTESTSVETTTQAEETSSTEENSTTEEPTSSTTNLESSTGSGDVRTTFGASPTTTMETTTILTTTEITTTTEAPPTSTEAPPTSTEAPPTSTEDPPTTTATTSTVSSTTTSTTEATTESTRVEITTQAEETSTAVNLGTEEATTTTTSMDAGPEQSESESTTPCNSSSPQPDGDLINMLMTESSEVDTSSTAVTSGVSTTSAPLDPSDATSVSNVLSEESNSTVTAETSTREQANNETILATEEWTTENNATVGDETLIDVVQTELEDDEADEYSTTTIVAVTNEETQPTQAPVDGPRKFELPVGYYYLSPAESWERERQEDKTFKLLLLAFSAISCATLLFMAIVVIYLKNRRRY